MIYTITISLINRSSLRFVRQSPYFNSGAKTDSISFNSNVIVIVAERNRRYDETDIFMNVQNSLYNQILKCLQIHYCNEGHQAGISQISIVADGVNISRLFTDAFQPFPSFDAPIKFKESALMKLLQEDSDSFALRMIVSHWFTQGLTTDRQRRLECIWRTFEQLCNHLRHVPSGSKSNISEGLDLMVNELVSNPASYPASAAFVSGESRESLRLLRWHDMIENNYMETPPGGNKSSNYQRFKTRLCDPYIDERVCTLMKDILPYRRRELQRYGLYYTIETELNNKITLHQKKDIDIVALLCYYAYYLRNRLFHGQTLVRCSIFDPNKTDDMRIDLLYGMLSILTVELINNYQAL